MSSSPSTESTDTETDADQNSGRQGRQVAKRAFAAEINDGTHVFKQSDEERAPNLALLPSGEIANRYFVVGTVTEIKDVGSDSEYWQARIVDPTGTLFVYAGQYQPQAASLFSSLEPPAYVAITGKPNAFDGDDGDTLVSLRPETVTVVDEATRDRWVRETIEQTEARLEAFVANPDDEFVAKSVSKYDPDPDTYWEVVNDARENVGMDPVEVPDADDVDEDPEAESETDASAETDALGEADDSPSDDSDASVTPADDAGADAQAEATAEAHSDSVETDDSDGAESVDGDVPPEEAAIAAAIADAETDE